MKKSTLSRLAVLFAFAPAFCLLIGCSAKPCEHQWTEADCVNAGSCALCGETQAEALGHDWAEAGCETPEHCTRCGETRAEALGHDWTEATCEHPEHCTRCGETRGDASEHSYGSWLLDSEVMYRVCTFCEQTENTEIDYALYLGQYVYGRWNLCSMVENGRYYEGQMLPQHEVDPEYIFHEDGRIVSHGFKEEELCTGWSVERGEYDSDYMQHRIYITSPENPDLGRSYFTCFGSNVYYEVPLNDKGDIATLSNSFGDAMAKLLAGTWSTWAADGLHHITLAEDRSFTADIDGEISGFWQPRQPISSPGYSSSSIYIMLNYEKGGKPYSQYATVNGINIDRPSQSNREQWNIATDANDTYMHFGYDAAQFLTEASSAAGTVHLGTWTSIDYTVGKQNYETYSYDEESGLSTEYSITFLEDGTFTADLHNDLKGRWELREIRRDYSGTVYVYRLLASGINDYSYFQMYHESESMHDAYLYISNNDYSGANYTLRQMNEAEIAAQNEFAAAAPSAIVGEWFSADGQTHTAAFREDGTFTLRSESAENEPPIENRGYWHFRSVSEYNGIQTYIYDMETIMETEEVAAAEESTGTESAASDDEETYREDYAIVLTVRDGMYSLEINSLYAWGWGELTNAEGLTVRADALAAVVGHWSAASATELDAETREGTEVAAEFSLDIAEDGSFTGYAGRNISGYLEFYENEDGTIRYLAHFIEGPEMDSLFDLDGDVLSAYVDPYSVQFKR